MTVRRLLALALAGALALVGGVMANRATTSTISPVGGSSEAPVSSCPQGSAFADGCASSPGGNFQQPKFFTSYAPQSGQTYVTRPPWNVVCVDYACGNYSTPSLDPATSPLPVGCVYSSKGNFVGGPEVVCAGVKNLSLVGWDFAAHGCVYLDLKNNLSGSITIKNNKFANGAGCTSQHAILVGAVSGGVLTVTSVTSGAVQVGDYLADQGAGRFTGAIVNSLGTGSGGVGTYYISGSWTVAAGTTFYAGNSASNEAGSLVTLENGGSASLDIENNYCDDKGDQQAYYLSNTCFVFNTSGSVTLKNNVLLRNSGRPLGTNTSGPLIVQGNYFEDFVFDPGQPHGETGGDFFSGLTQPSEQYSYNVCFNSARVFPAGATTCFYPAPGFANSTITYTQVDHNVAIANKANNHGGGYTVSAVLVEAGGANMDRVVIEDNYFDATGALAVAYEFSGVCAQPASFSGNVDLVTGAEHDAWDINTGKGC
jgi:hypothetical protein